MGIGFNKNLYFFLTVILISLYYDYQTIITKPPQSIHVWRQADGASLALNYYENGLPFFKPEIHSLNSDNKTTGYAVGEFPALYYMAAIAYNLFGHHDSILRILNLLLFYLGLFALYRCAFLILDDRFWGIFISVLLFTSPVIVFYANNFLPNVPALSFVFLGWYHFILYHHRRKIKNLNYSFIFFTVAGLLKITSLLTFIPLIFILFLESVGVMKKLNIASNFVNRPKHTILLIALHVISILSWYIYAISYNLKHKTEYFSTEIWPIWNLDSVVIQAVIEKVDLIWKHEYFSPITLYFFLALIVIMIIQWKKQNTFFSYMNITIGLGAFLYVLLWFFAFQNHDYYFIDILGFCVFLLFSFLNYLKSSYLKIFQSNILKLLCLGFLAYNLGYANTKITERYSSSSWMNNLGNKAELWKIKPALFELGISQKDKVISIPDPSPNHTLYTINRPGWTDFYGDASSAERISSLIDLGAKYLIINDTTIIKNRPYLKEFTSNKIYNKSGVQIFELSAVNSENKEE